ncbi:uncharacterized protein LAESUDRAFT_722764 [Laetiporus sulphureus 93-53]|uniref:Uncharacterized protein n=1 Tax=Laetiporus sulphureus 93-53 TaxID=1314785 RepID=A0A165G3T8_9APHY|nr:uncharacterized protein LAESUDRAFT_722764 [Laetiporus sulphureus 93-53]KZT09790.1 hypothetical protein LAESUDRAFT_722764 [Laetiporus sulphureus 93-53]
MATSAVAHQYPFTEARSTGTDSATLLAALLASECFDEISNVEDFGGVRDYIVGEGRPDAEGRLAFKGLAFWVYPTGLHGPFHETEEGTIERHGLLVTIERRAKVEDAMRRIREEFSINGIGHVHIAAA